MAEEPSLAPQWLKSGISAPGTSALRTGSCQLPPFFVSLNLLQVIYAQFKASPGYQRQYDDGNGNTNKLHFTYLVG